MIIFKRILVAILALVMSAGLCGFTACEDGFGGSVKPEDNGVENEENSDNTTEGDTSNSSDGNNKIGLTEDSDFVALVSEKVTAEEWVAIFSDDIRYSNCTEKYVDQTTYYQKFQTVGDIYSVFVIDPSNPNSNGYFKIVDEEIYYTTFESQTGWEKAEDAELIEIWSTWGLTYRVWCPDLSEFFDRFTYNEVLGQYEFLGSRDNCITTMGTGGYRTVDFYNITVKIYDGKIAYVTADGITTYFYDFGTTSFDIPE